jgi:DNA-binding NarL/FixJ family response regulator
MSADPLPVWIIEDDQNFRETIRQVLDFTVGLACTAAHGSVEDALADAGVARRTNSLPRVVLLDVNLPGQTGIEGLAALKAALPEARIVMLTIKDDAETVYGALGAGASGYLVKSAGVDQIVVAVREAAAGGMLMPAPVARRVLAAFQQPAPAQPDRYNLTPREQQVLSEMVDGYTQKEIGQRLGVSPHTVNSHVQNIYEKLHVNSGNAAVAKALRERILHA